VIFNWKGDLQKDHILSTLGIMARAAQNVAQDSSSSAASSATTSAATSSSAKATKFGHLHIVFRDWQAVGSDAAAVFSALFDREGSRDAGTRDQIRVDVQSAFESVRVWLFDAPCNSVKDLKKRLTLDMASAEFRAQLRGLRSACAAQLAAPTVFAGALPRPVLPEIVFFSLRFFLDSFLSRFVSFSLRFFLASFLSRFVSFLASFLSRFVSFSFLSRFVSRFVSFSLRFFLASFLSRFFLVSFLASFLSRFVSNPHPITPLP
jgi:hypothetical protein